MQNLSFFIWSVFNGWLNYWFALYYPQYHSNKRNNEENVDYAAKTVSEKADCPGNDEDYGDEVK